MKQYAQISKEERYTINIDLKSGFSYREIARNKGLRGYRHLQAEKFASQRRNGNCPSLTAFALAYIKHLLELKWSPEQISGAHSF